MNQKIIQVDALESEAIYIFREVVAQFEKPVLLFSGGKDSITLVRLAQKAFFPAKIPFPLLHIDTGHNFPETIDFRDKLVKELGVELHVRNVQDNIDSGRVKEETGRYASNVFDGAKVAWGEHRQSFEEFGDEYNVFPRTDESVLPIINED